MNGKFLLDTNIVIALFAGEEQIANNLSQTTEIFISTTVLGELFYSALKSAQVSENLKKIEGLASTCTIIDNNIDTAKEYARIKVELTNQGKPIPENDIWIAAVARQHDLIIVTRDEHFSAISPLKQTQW